MASTGGCAPGPERQLGRRLVHQHPQAVDRGRPGVGRGGPARASAGAHRPGRPPPGPAAAGRARRATPRPGASPAARPRHADRRGVDHQVGGGDRRRSASVVRRPPPARRHRPGRPPRPPAPASGSAPPRPARPASASASTTARAAPRPRRPGTARRRDRSRRPAPARPRSPRRRCCRPQRRRPRLMTQLTASSRRAASLQLVDQRGHVGLVRHGHRQPGDAEARMPSSAAAPRRAATSKAKERQCTEAERGEGRVVQERREGVGDRAPDHPDHGGVRAAAGAGPRPSCAARAGSASSGEPT